MGVKIGEQAIGDKYGDVFAWHYLDNRPYLRALHGYGLTHWRLERYNEALNVFQRMLWLNPSDNQGVRFLVSDVKAKKPWKENALTS
jgi:tetratricopeptide (TPR) repeat protein